MSILGYNYHMVLTFEYVNFGSFIELTNSFAVSCNSLLLQSIPFGEPAIQSVVVSLIQKKQYKINWILCMVCYNKMNIFLLLTLYVHWLPNILVPILDQILIQKFLLHQHSLDLQLLMHSKFLPHGDPPVVIINIITYTLLQLNKQLKM